MNLHLILAAVLVLGTSVVHAADTSQDATYDPVRAQQAWTLNCMGCHTSDAGAIPGKIPPLRGTLGHFVRLPEGREFIMRVPGASNSALSDAELANVLNWLIATKNRGTAPADFKPFTAEEVASKRRPAITDVAVHRAALVDKLNQAGDSAVPKKY